MDSNNQLRLQAVPKIDDDEDVHKRRGKGEQIQDRAGQHTCGCERVHKKCIPLYTTHGNPAGTSREQPLSTEARYPKACSTLHYKSNSIDPYTAARRRCSILPWNDLRLSSVQSLEKVVNLTEQLHRCAQQRKDSIARAVASAFAG